MVKKKGRPESDRTTRPKGRAPVKLPEATLLTEDDLYLFNEGTDYRIYQKLGAHPLTVNGRPGTYFAVWAPDAKKVSVVGDFNSWDGAAHPLQPRGQSGIWEGFIPGVAKGALYKYHVTSRYKGLKKEKTDPLAI
jgi:1,4-alpha-glucan branching enzyme